MASQIDAQPLWLTGRTAAPPVQAAQALADPVVAALLGHKAIGLDHPHELLRSIVDAR